MIGQPFSAGEGGVLHHIWSTHGFGEGFGGILTGSLSVDLNRKVKQGGVLILSDFGDDTGAPKAGISEYGYGLEGMFQSLKAHWPNGCQCLPVQPH